ncbi:MAG: DUF692 domain-containing protein [Alphaproteobacteria bacterium]|nr:DUF692 domain-containing protein [Alphaproteobacteria bacterium]
MLPRAGIGLRAVHHEAVAETRPDIGWFEIHAENYLGGGSPVQTLDAVRRDYPVALHGVGLSLGSAQGLDDGHLDRIAALAERIEPFLVSEHLSWSVVDGRYLNDLLPLPYTREALDIVAANVGRLQDRLKRRILVENPSTYLRFRASEMKEWEFLRALVRRSGCGLLCDVNNIHVSARNHGFDASAYLAALPADAVGELHLAGHAVNEADGIGILIDDHGSPVGDAVWRLFDQAVALFPSAPALVEWDSNIPPLARLVAEARQADRRRAETASALRSEPAPTRARVA